MPVLASDVLQCLDRVFAIEFRFGGPLAVLVGQRLVCRVEARDIAVHKAARVAAPDPPVGLRCVEIPGPQQAAVSRQFAILAGVQFIGHEGDPKAEIVQPERRQCSDLTQDKQA